VGTIAKAFNRKGMMFYKAWYQKSNGKGFDWLLLIPLAFILMVIYPLFSTKNKKPFHRLSALYHIADQACFENYVMESNNRIYDLDRDDPVFFSDAFTRKRKHCQAWIYSMTGLVDEYDFEIKEFIHHPFSCVVQVDRRKEDGRSSAILAFAVDRDTSIKEKDHKFISDEGIENWSKRMGDGFGEKEILDEYCDKYYLSRGINKFD